MPDGHRLRAADAHDAGFQRVMTTCFGQLMLMMLALGGGWPQATGNDAHDAGFRRWMATGYGQLMLMMLAFSAGWRQATGS